MTRTDHRLHSPPALMLVIAAALATTALPTAPARADSDSPSVVVRYGDLDLGRAAGVERLYQRLNVAAKQVCGSPTSGASRIVSRDWELCVASAVDRAVKQVDRPAVTAYHLARAHPAGARQTAALNDRR